MALIGKKQTSETKMIYVEGLAESEAECPGSWKYSPYMGLRETTTFAQ